MIDILDDGFLADDEAMNDMIQEDLIMDNLTDDAALGTGGFDDMNSDSIVSDDIPLADNGLNINSNEEVGIGNLDDSGHILQTTDHTCAVVSQQMVLNEFGIVDQVTGMPISEAQLVSDAYSNGWLTQDGTTPENLGNLLEHYGVGTHRSQGVENMISELAQGHSVIVGVDSGELSGADSIFEDLFSGEQADHAIVVKGMKVDESGNIEVIVNDPGDPLGAGREYPIDDFVDAFEDGGCHYVATDNAPPDFEPIESNYTGKTIASNENPGNTNNPAIDSTSSLDHSPENMTEADKDDILFGLDSRDLKNIAKAAAHTIRSL